MPQPTAPSNPGPEGGPLNREQLRAVLLRALRLPTPPGELLPVMQQQPAESIDLLADCLAESHQTPERERIAELAGGLGRAGLERLEQRWIKGAPEEAVGAVPLLARLAPDFLQQYLLPRAARWEHHRQDAVVKAIAFSGSRERGRLLQSLAEAVHPYVLPGLLDEIGTAGDVRTVPWLMRLAAGEALQAADLYVRVKAIEALGRIGAPTAGPLLARLLEARRLWRWEHPRELRLCALQALGRIDARRARELARTAGLPEREVSLRPLEPQPGAARIRHRRYARVHLARPLPVRLSLPLGTIRLGVEVLSLAGGFARPLPGAEEADAPRVQTIPPGTTTPVEFQTRLRPIRATAVVRNQVAAGVGFELVAIDLDARTRMRQLLAAFHPAE